MTSQRLHHMTRNYKDDNHKTLEKQQLETWHHRKSERWHQKNWRGDTTETREVKSHLKEFFLLTNNVLVVRQFVLKSLYASTVLIWSCLAFPSSSAYSQKRAGKKPKTNTSLSRISSTKWQDIVVCRTKYLLLTGRVWKVRNFYGQARQYYHVR